MVGYLHLGVVEAMCLRTEMQISACIANFLNPVNFCCQVSRRSDVEICPMTSQPHERFCAHHHGFAYGDAIKVAIDLNEKIIGRGLSKLNRPVSQKIAGFKTGQDPA
jgi:hypothetical protein